jgi:putative endonuclease
MDQYFTYVLYSASFDKIYIGFTKDLTNRFLSHNEKAQKGWTVRFRPWEVLFYETFSSKSEAMRREKELKTSRGRNYIRNFLKEKNQTSVGFISQ